MVLLTPHGNTSLPRPSPGLLVVFAAGPEDGFPLCSLSIFSGGLIVSLCNLPVHRHNKPPLHQTCFQALYHGRGFLGLQLHLAPNPPQWPDAAQDRAEQRSSLLPYSRVCLDFLSSVSFLLPSPLTAQPGSPHPRYCCSRSQLPQWGRRQELLWGCSGVLWGTAAPAPRASKHKLRAGRCSSAPVGPAPGLSSAPCGAGGRGARGALLPPLCSSRALVSGEQLPSLTRYSWNSLKPMDWKMPCW